VLEHEWLKTPCAKLNPEARAAAEARQAVLTKPPGALGRLEALAIQLAAMQGKVKPTVEQVRIVVFAADHGIAAEGVSAFPQAVTAEMVRNFANGGAAISVLARQLNAGLEVINLGTVVDPGPLNGVSDQTLAAGTANFARQAAMTEEQLAAAMNIGRQSVELAISNGMDLFIGGEMGIGNTSSATALASALTELSVEGLAGPGTGLDADGVSHKVKVIQAALELHRDKIKSPMDALRYFGGFEIAALSGAYIACAQIGVPVLVDGFIATVAALMAVKQSPGTADWLLYSHASAEPGHRHVVELLSARPLLDMDMCLGEGSGAAIAVPLLRLACALHNDMATFADAEVSVKL
jgi:nicotinate-nucleotide--dimethylbenzimidazole phosphoribosyltransferase